jgi:hypothetical protein
MLMGGWQSLEPTPELLKDYRELRGVFMRARLFKSSKLYYTLKCLVNALLLAASIAIICLTQSLPAVLLSAFILGVCWQQCGWLSHDFLHHQVSPPPPLLSLSLTHKHTFSLSCSGVCSESDITTVIGICFL